MTTPITYETIRNARRAGTLAAWLVAMTPRERVEAAEVVAANSNHTVTSALDFLARYVAEQQAPAPVGTEANPLHILDGAAFCGYLPADERRQLRDAWEAAAERDALVEALLAEGADKAADYVAAGATWSDHGEAVVVQRAGGHAHRVEGGRCTCPARGRCWAMDVADALTLGRRVEDEEAAPVAA